MKSMNNGKQGRSARVEARRIPEKVPHWCHTGASEAVRNEEHTDAEVVDVIEDLVFGMYEPTFQSTDFLSVGRH